MRASRLAVSDTLRRVAEAVPRLFFPAVLGVSGLLIVAKSGLLIKYAVLDGARVEAESNVPSTAAPPPLRDRPPPMFLLEPQAGPAPADQPATAAGADGATEPGALGEPRQFTDTELELLGMLSERRAALDEREQRLDLRAAMLETAKAKLTEQLEQLKALRASIEARIEEHDEAEEAELGRLVKIYERMKPKAAAAIFDRLDMEVLLEVVARMSETKASAVIARMEPARARQLTSELAAREELARLDR